MLQCLMFQIGEGVSIVVVPGLNVSVILPMLFCDCLKGSEMVP